MNWITRKEEFLGRYTTYSESDAYRITHARTLAGNAAEYHLTIKDRSQKLFVSQFHGSLKKAKEYAELDARMQARKETIGQMRENTSTLWDSALKADDAWQKELIRLFGKRAGDVRYTQQGAGEPGSVLRSLHDKAISSAKKWREEHKSQNPGSWQSI